MTTKIKNKKQLRYTFNTYTIFYRAFIYKCIYIIIILTTSGDCMKNMY